MTTQEMFFGTRAHPVNQELMAQAVGTHRTTIGRYRKNIDGIPLGVLKRIIRYQGLTKEDVWKMVQER